MKFQGRAHLVDTGFSDLPSARKFETALRRSLASGRLAELQGLHLRQAKPSLLIRDLLPHWRTFAAGAGMAERSRRGYEGALRSLWVAGTNRPAEAFESAALEELTPSLVFAWKCKLATRLPAGDEARERQGVRGGNSLLRQAKGIFSRRALEHYRQVGGLDLPACISEFVAAPGFAAETEEEYHLPSEAVVAATFRDLEEVQRTQNPNLYLAVWLALGFGLRRSEIAAVRAGWFRRSADQVQLELRSVVVPGRAQEKARTKNGETWPIIDVSNGAWGKLEPFVAMLQPEDYLLRCETASERVEAVPEAVGRWMRSLGWETQKTLHEWRAFAGCQVAMRDGIEAASRWLRHSSILVTQRHYGRYLRPKVTNAPIALPHHLDRSSV